MENRQNQMILRGKLKHLGLSSWLCDWSKLGNQCRDLFHTFTWSQVIHANVATNSLHCSLTRACCIVSCCLLLHKRRQIWKWSATMVVVDFVASSRCNENSAWPFEQVAFDYLNTLSLCATCSLFKHTLTAHTLSEFKHRSPAYGLKPFVLDQVRRKWE